MCDQFLKVGAPIDKIYYSPFHPLLGRGKYLKDDYSRKPHPGMILQAKRELDLDLNSSLLIGDKSSDIQAGLAAGVGKNVLFSSDRAQLPDTLTCQYVSSLVDIKDIIEKMPRY